MSQFPVFRNFEWNFINTWISQFFLLKFHGVNSGIFYFKCNLYNQKMFNAFSSLNSIWLNSTNKKIQRERERVNKINKFHFQTSHCLHYFFLILLLFFPEMHYLLLNCLNHHMASLAYSMLLFIIKKCSTVLCCNAEFIF